MKNQQRGFIVPFLLVITAVLLVGGGVYMFTQNKQQIKSATNETTRTPNQVTPAQNTTNTPTSSVTNITCTSGRTMNPPADLPPVITSLSSSSGPIGTVLEIKGCNLSGFEGDLDVTFEKSDGTKIILTDKFGTYATTQDTLIKVVVKEPCAQGETVYGAYSGIPTICNYTPLKLGTYRVYTMPWGKKSNEMTFTISE